MSLFISLTSQSITTPYVAGCPILDAYCAARVGYLDPPNVYFRPDSNALFTVVLSLSFPQVQYIPR
jgi:hypothetical protein